jgi:hypothetical protein
MVMYFFCDNDKWAIYFAMLAFRQDFGLNAQMCKIVEWIWVYFMNYICCFHDNVHKKKEKKFQIQINMWLKVGIIKLFEL